MVDRNDMEQRFSAHLDAVLSGGELPAAPDLDDEHREALEFAAKMVQLRESPSPAFRNALRVRLLDRLARGETPVEKRGGFFSGAFWRQPAWQAASLVVVAIIVVVVFWRVGAFSPGLEPQPTVTPTTTATTTATMTTAPQGWILSADAMTDKAVYQAGETVRIDVTLRNTTAAPVTLEKLPPILSLMEAETHQPVYTFSAGDVSQTLGSNDIATFTYEWDQRDFDGQPVTGTYYISLEDLESDGMPLQIELDRPAEFEITSY